MQRRLAVSLSADPTPLLDEGHVYYSEATGLAYPVLGGIPLLRPEHMVVASKLKAFRPAAVS